jgi:LacI family transcriptional regulator
LDRLHAKGVPVTALVSDLTAETRAGYVGLDNRKVGRTAGWFVSGLAGRPGKVAIFVGSHRYLCQETCESGFRSYLRENTPDFELLEPITTLESELYAYENTLDLLRRSPDLVGLYIAGGGAEGVLRALAENGGRNGAGDRIVTVCLDLTEHTRTGLIDNIVQAVISHPIGALANRAVELMARQTCSAEERNQFSQVIIPFEIFTPESV